MTQVDEMPKNYDDAKQTLARWHAEDQDTPFKIFAFDDPQQQDPKQKEVRLVEVSDAFPATGEALAVAFGRSVEFPYRSAVVLVTPDEWKMILDGKLHLPSEWRKETMQQVWPR